MQKTTKLYDLSMAHGLNTDTSIQMTLADSSQQQVRDANDRSFLPEGSLQSDAVHEYAMNGGIIKRKQRPDGSRPGDSVSKTNRLVTGEIIEVG